MRKILETFCFDEDSLSAEELSRLMSSEWLRFEPSRFAASFQRKTIRYNPKQHRDRVCSEESVGWLRLESPPDLRFSKATLVDWNLEVLYWALPEGAQLASEQIDHLITLPGFNAAYLTDPEDDFWQSADEINEYEVSGRDHSHLPKKQTDSGRVVLDVSGQPGRRTPFPGLWLQAAPRMWFGGKVFDYIPRNRLLSFPEANRVEELSSGVIFIELFEDPFAASLPENRAKQKAFRDWVWMDDLEKMAPGLPRGTDDLAFKIETGSFPHGGVRRVTQWMGEDGRPTRSSRAVKKISIEYGEGGEVVWRETVKIEP